LELDFAAVLGPAFVADFVVDPGPDFELEVPARAGPALEEVPALELPATVL
jgi:hypothetical protein